LPRYGPNEAPSADNSTIFAHRTSECGMVRERTIDSN
jgi:hypothetical protein